MFNGKNSRLVLSMLDSEVRDLCWRPCWVNVLYPWIKHLIIIVPLSLSLPLGVQESTGQLSEKPAKMLGGNLGMNLHLIQGRSSNTPSSCMLRKTGHAPAGWAFQLKYHGTLPYLYLKVLQKSYPFMSLFKSCLRLI